jgi:hypothetical protein
MKWLWLNLRHHPAIYLLREGGAREGGDSVVVFYLTPCKTTLVDAQCNTEKNKCHLQLSATNLHSNGQPLTVWIFCRVH